MPEYPPSLCPLCAQVNRCAVEIERSTGQPQGPCWCAQLRFDAELLNRIPPEARGVACLCPDCATRDSA